VCGNGRRHKVLLHVELTGCIEDKHLCACLNLRAEIKLLFHEISFLLQQTTKTQTQVTRFEYLADIFFKMNELSLALQEK
jgi:hypothetical protein